MIESLAVTAHYEAKELARLCDISPRQLQREFRRRFGCSPQNWLNERRIQAAQQLLLLGQPVKVVALELGYKQTSHFCRHFKQQLNMTPSQFIRDRMGSFDVVGCR
ncbi:MAG TPA: helix-turn-helix transcriptional regulator [Desulfuromonadaceae bacterium]|nr:helix-turn-helix transcriptional regulator [Desulfuromonadaceae bacterium]